MSLKEFKQRTTSSFLWEKTQRSNRCLQTGFETHYNFLVMHVYLLRRTRRFSKSASPATGMPSCTIVHGDHIKPSTDDCPQRKARLLHSPDFSVRVQTRGEVIRCRQFRGLFQFWSSLSGSTIGTVSSSTNSTGSCGNKKPRPIQRGTEQLLALTLERPTQLHKWVSKSHN